MNILITILLVLAGLVALVLIVALFIRKEHFSSREIVIDADPKKIFNFLKMIENQDRYNKWAKTDPDRRTATKGTDGTVGYVYSWSGNKSAGEGEKEILNLIDGKKMEMEIRFVKPFKAIAQLVMTTEPVSGHRTKVTWSNKSKLNYPLNIMVPMVEKSLAKDMDESLVKLKNILENDSNR